jgi:hypothetical protein
MSIALDADNSFSRPPLRPSVRGKAYSMPFDNALSRIRVEYVVSRARNRLLGLWGSWGRCLLPILHLHLPPPGSSP